MFSINNSGINCHAFRCILAISSIRRDFPVIIMPITIIGVYETFSAREDVVFHYIIIIIIIPSETRKNAIAVNGFINKKIIDALVRKIRKG